MQAIRLQLVEKYESYQKITLFLLVFTLVFASVFFLVACNEQQEDEGDITRDLYVYAIAFEDAGATEEESSAKVQADADSSADKTAIVYLTFQNGQENRGCKRALAQRKAQGRRVLFCHDNQDFA